MNKTYSKWPGRIALAGLGCAGLAILCVVLAGPGYRFAILDVGGALGLTLIAVVVGLIALCLGIIAIFMIRAGGTQDRLGAAITAAVIGFIFCVGFIGSFQKARTLPPIHDISTDVTDPPRFVHVIPLRDRAKNPPDYDGPEVARKQLAAYPEVKSIYSSVSGEGVIAAAKQVAEEMGWQVISSDSSDAAEGYLEAVATTFWFGFKDDVVVRARDNGFESTIDIRSKSRVGISDLGANAKRILEFSRRLEKKLEN